MPAAMLDERAGRDGQEGLHRLAHLLGFDRQDDDVRRRGARGRLAHGDAEARGERFASGRVRLDHGDVRAGEAARDEAAHDGGAHVAASQEQQLHGVFSSILRSPNDGRSDAQHRGALRERGGKVVRHAH